MATHTHEPHTTQLPETFKAELLERIYKIPCIEGFNMTITHLELGRCELSAPRNPQLDGIFECVHGGILATLADTAACFAIMTHTGTEQILSTTDMNIRFLAPCLTTVKVVAQVIKPGKLLCPVQVDLYDEHEKHVATAQVTYIRLNTMPKRP